MTTKHCQEWCACPDLIKILQYCPFFLISTYCCTVKMSRDTYLSGDCTRIALNFQLVPSSECSTSMYNRSFNNNYNNTSHNVLSHQYQQTSLSINVRHLNRARIHPSQSSVPNHKTAKCFTWFHLRLMVNVHDYRLAQTHCTDTTRR